MEQLLSPSPGGIGRYSGQLAMLLARIPPADEVVPFVARHPAPTVREALGAVGIDAPAVVLPWPRAVLYESWVRWGRPRLERALPGCDVVHAPSLAVPGRGRAPLVVTAYDAAPELFPEAFSAHGRAFHRRGAAAAARRADLVIAVSHSAADEIVACTPIRQEALRVVHLAIDPPGGSREGAAPPGGSREGAVPPGEVLEEGAAPPSVLWVGSREPRKGVGTLVEAMAARARRGAPRARLVLAGYPGWLSDGLVAPADRDALGEDLVELGPLSERELWRAYREATVFAFPSRHEGFGLPPLEAMSQGTPVVASDLPVTREVLGDAALLVQPGDVSAWADALDALLTDEAVRSRYAEAGPSWAARYTPERMIDATRAVYREAAGG